MVKQKALYRFAFPVIALAFLACLLGSAACSAPEPAETPGTVPPPTPILKPIPTIPPPENIQEATLPPGGPVLPHTFWGHVETDSGKPATGVEVSVTVNGKPQKLTITTDDTGKYGGDLLIEFPSSLSVTGKKGDLIEFFVDGQPAQEIRLGSLKEVGGEYQWEWKDLDPEWYVIFAEGGHNCLDLVYTPAK